VQLNIKSDEAYRLAAEVAARNGESMTDVVLRALRREAERTAGGRKSPTEAERIIARVDSMLAPLHARLRDAGKPVPGNAAFDDWMYDERGLPR
jgi:antitoxin VapB